MKTTVDQIIQQAKLVLNEGKLEEAKILFQNIIQVQPTHYKSHTNIGAILIKLGKFILPRSSLTVFLLLLSPFFLIL